MTDRYPKPPRFSEEWWRMRFFELVGAGILAFILIMFSQMWAARTRVNTPPGAWLAVYEIWVPDHKTSDDPMITYDREVRQDFDGVRSVELQKINPNGTFVSICTGEFHNYYEVGEVIPDNLVKLSWFIANEECQPFEPGQYRLRADYLIEVQDWPPKRTSASSNVFTVTE